MKTNIELDVKLWRPPNFAIIKSPDPEAAQDISLPLSALDPLTLDRLCREYRDEVFKKAGKSPPPEEAPRCSKCGEYK
jgi:hypothetical protein